MEAAENRPGGRRSDPQPVSLYPSRIGDRCLLARPLLALTSVTTVILDAVGRGCVKSRGALACGADVRQG